MASGAPIGPEGSISMAARSEEGSEPLVVVFMGVCGCGKSTVGQLLAERLGWEFREGDRFHPPANIRKMRSGRPLEDADRLPWLRAIREAMRQCIRQGRPAVFTCSALKRSYRDLLRTAGRNVRFVHLAGDFELLARRLRERKGHFMPPSLLASQLATLEPPQEEVDVLVLEASASPEELVRAIVLALAISGRKRGRSRNGTC